MTLRSARPARVSIELNEWQSRGPRDDERLRGLELGDQRVQAALETLRGRVDIRLLRDGVEINTTSFVGRIEIGPLDLVIRPKLPTMPLAQLLRYAYGLRDLSVRGPTQATIDRHGFHDLLIAMLASEIRELLARGLSRHYIPVQERLATPRGRLLVAELSCRGGVTEAKLDCRHHRRSADWLLNQVLRAGLIAAARMTRDRDLLRDVHELAAQFGDVRAMPALLKRDLDSVERGLTRLTDSNAPALTIIRLLQDMMGFDFRGMESSSPLPGFLFDMNSFFQRLLSRFLRENLAGVTIVDDRRISHMLAYGVDANPKRRSAPQPRPDYALMRGSEVVGFLDAKYRDVWRVGAPASWIYQLSMYALAALRRASIMLYPCLDADACDERLEVQQPLAATHERLAAVTMRPVPLLQLAALLQSDGPAAVSARQQLAHRLVNFDRSVDSR